VGTFLEKETSQLEGRGRKKIVKKRKKKPSQSKSSRGGENQVAIATGGGGKRGLGANSKKKKKGIEKGFHRVFKRKKENFPLGQAAEMKLKGSRGTRPPQREGKKGCRRGFGSAPGKGSLNL